MREPQLNAFQVVDFKRHCKSKFYLEGDFEDSLSVADGITWRYNSHIKGPHNHDYAYIWSQGKTLLEACPDGDKEYFSSLVERFKAFYVSFREAKLDEQDLCFFDTVPIKFLKEWCEIQNTICTHVVKTKMPYDYHFQRELSFLIEEIRSRKLRLDWSDLNPASKKIASLLKVRNENRTSIHYNQYGTVTGRLSTTPSSFPILTIDRTNRAILKPTNDLLVELDYNSAELRTVLALAEKEQPDVDIHSWINSRIFNNEYTRKEVKEKVFAWLYNPNAENKDLTSLFERDKVLQKYYCFELVTPFKRVIEVDDRKAFNYLIQSTTSDIVLRQALKIRELLKDTESFISYIIHDSIVLDINKEQQPLLNEIIKTFSDTDFGEFKVNVSVGKDYGNMRRVECQR